MTGDNQADTTLSSVEHEHLEAITDPRGNAWQDSTGGAGENGDKCNRNMGVANSSSTTVNNFLGGSFGDFFRIQREWSNAAALASRPRTAARRATRRRGSHVEAPTPTGGDVTASVTEATIPGNNGDALHYHVSFHDPSNQDDAFSITDSAVVRERRLGPELDRPRRPLARTRRRTATSPRRVTGGPLLDGTVLTSTFTTQLQRLDRRRRSRRSPAPRRRPSSTRRRRSTVPGAADARTTTTRSRSGSRRPTPTRATRSRSARAGCRPGSRFTDNGNRTGTVSGTITAAARRLHRDVHRRRPPPPDARRRRRCRSRSRGRRRPRPTPGRPSSRRASR